EEPDGDPAPNLEKRARRRASGAALTLGFLVPFPVTCLLLRAPLLGTAFLGVFVGALVKIATFKRGTAPLELLWLLAADKVGDLLVALVIAMLRRRRA